MSTSEEVRACMRVTFLVPNYAPSVGGAQSHVQHIAEGLVSAFGHEVSVVTTDAYFAPGGRRPGRVHGAPSVINGVGVLRVPYARRVHGALRDLRRAGRRLGMPRSPAGSMVAAGPLGARFARASRLAARRSDVVIGVAAPFATVLAGELSCRGLSTGYVSMPLLHLEQSPPRPWVVRTLRRADGCTSSTRYERDWLASNGVSESRLAVLPPGCFPERFADLTCKEARRRLRLPERDTVGFIGRFAAHKGIDTLASSMQLLWADRPDTTLLLAGGRTAWPGLDDLLERLRELGGDRLVVREDFDDDARSVLMSACEVIAFPSREESFGMVTIESWCARRPVVAADIAAVHALIRDGVDGDLVPVDDAPALAAALGSLLDDPDRRWAYGQAGRSRAESEFSWPRIIEGWDGFLSASVGRRRAT